MSQFQSLAKVQKNKGLQRMSQESERGDLHETAATNHNENEVMEAARVEAMEQFRQRAETAMEEVDNKDSHPIVVSTAQNTSLISAVIFEECMYCYMGRKYL